MIQLMYLNNLWIDETEQCIKYQNVVEKKEWKIEIDTVGST